jgi:hypothetical protein
MTDPNKVFVVSCVRSPLPQPVGTDYPDESSSLPCRQHLNLMSVYAPADKRALALMRFDQCNIYRSGGDIKMSFLDSRTNNN